MLSGDGGEAVASPDDPRLVPPFRKEPQEDINFSSPVQPGQSRYLVHCLVLDGIWVSLSEWAASRLGMVLGVGLGVEIVG